MEASTEVKVIEDISDENAPTIYVKGGLQKFLDAVTAEVVSEVPDLTTKKGRDRIASLAAKVSKSKVAVEKPGREYLARLKEMPKVVEAELRDFVRAMDTLRDETRKPLSDWEDAEKARVDRIQAQVSKLGDTDVTDMSASEIKESIDNLEAHVIDAQYEEFEQEAHRVKAVSLVVLRTAHAVRQQYENEQAELAELRRRQAEQEQKDREERISREAAEAERVAAEQRAQAERDAAAQRERDLIEQAAQAQRQAEQEKRDAEAAAERQRLQLELQAAEAERQAAQAERDRIAAEQRAEQERADAVRRQAEAVERAEQAERRRQADEAARIEAEAKAREADRAHKGAILKAAKEAIQKAGVTEEQAKAVVKMIAAGSVPSVSISY